MAGRRIGGAGGGSDPARRGSGVAVAVTLVVTIGLGGSGVTATSSVSASRSPSGRSTSHERESAEISTEDFKSAEFKLARKGLRVKGRFEPDGPTCAQHSYGMVKSFFSQHPCSALYRAQLELGDKEGDVVLVAISWVQMPDEESAIAYNTLVDAPGTGNVVELSREGGRYRTVRYTGLRYRSKRKNALVSNAQAEPVARGWTGVAFTTIVNASA